MQQHLDRAMQTRTEVGIEMDNKQRIFGQVIDYDLDGDFPTIHVGRPDGEQYAVMVDKVISVRVRKDPNKDRESTGARSASQALPPRG